VVPNRLAGLEELVLPECSRTFVASTFSSRLLGLAWIAELPSDCGLLIPCCRSVHTFGMRFDLDVYFIDRSWRTIAIVRELGPSKVCSRRGAAAVLERPAARRDRAR